MTNSYALKEKSFQTKNETRKKQIRCARLIGSCLFATAIFSLAVAFPTLAHASVESSLTAVQEKLVGTLLPLAAMCGLVIAGLSFVAGHPNARQHLVYAIVGAIVGFGSESIVAFIRNLIH